jgi:hypothetical protein
MKNLIIMTLLIFTAAASAHAGDTLAIKDGIWEITTKMDAPGMSMPPATNRQCLTSRDIIPQGNQLSRDCRIFYTRVDGNTVTWAMKCNEKAVAIAGKGSVTYAGESFAGRLTMTMNDPAAGAMTINSTMTGRRVGDCK